MIDPSRINSTSKAIVEAADEVIRREGIVCSGMALMHLGIAFLTFEGCPPHLMVKMVETLSSQGKQVLDEHRKEDEEKPESNDFSFDAQKAATEAIKKAMEKL